MTYQTYVEILRTELVPATGCTEPIAIAFCAAKARETLGAVPEKVEIEVSGNVMKNVKSVTVPNSNGGRGIAVAAAIGIVAGDPSKKLEVIARATLEQIARMEAYIERTAISVKLSYSDLLLDISVRVSAGEESAEVRLMILHSTISLLR